MTEFIERPELLEEDRFPGLAELLDDFLTPQLSHEVDPFDSSQVMAMFIDTLSLDLPIEFQELRDENNHFYLGASTPTQWIETSVQPVLHRVRVTLQRDTQWDLDLQDDAVPDASDVKQELKHNLPVQVEREHDQP